MLIKWFFTYLLLACSVIDLNSFHGDFYSKFSRVSSEKVSGFYTGVSLRSTPSSHSNFYHKRVPQSFAVDSAIIEYASQYGIARKDLVAGCVNGNEYHLHAEFIQQLAQAIQLSKIYQGVQECSFFLNVASEGIALGIEANKRHESVMARRLAEFGWELLEIAKGIGEGVASGLYNAVHFAANIACHPMRAAGEMVYGIGQLLYAVSKVVGMPAHLAVHCLAGNQEQLYKQAQCVYEQMKLIMQACMTQLVATSNRTIAKHMTVFVTDVVFTGKLLMFAKNICFRAEPLITQVMKVLDKQPVVKCAIAGVGNVVHELNEAVQPVGPAVKKILSPVRKIFSDLAIKEALEKLSYDKNRIHHILTPKTGKHAWVKLCKNALDWKEVRDIIEKVMKNGYTIERKSGFEKVLTIKNEEVIVRYLDCADRGLTITNAWVRAK